MPWLCPACQGHIGKAPEIHAIILQGLPEGGSMNFNKDGDLRLYLGWALVFCLICEYCLRLWTSLFQPETRHETGLFRDLLELLASLISQGI